MTLQNIGLYILPSIIAILTAYLAHKRSVRAHQDTTVIDRQKLANETYELVLQEVREELTRRSKQYLAERNEWIEREKELLAEIHKLEERIKVLEEDMLRYTGKDRRIEEGSHDPERRSRWDHPFE